jgi:N-acetylmuramic acid 6-phosphate etherase
VAVSPVGRGRDDLWRRLETLETERSHPATRDLDCLDEESMVRLIHREDRQVWRAVDSALPEIVAAARLAAAALAQGGRIIYVGAGTSGRLGVLDAAECPPTFGTPAPRVRGIIAGGARALRHSIEGAEDRAAEGKSRISSLRCGASDLVIGIAASRRTPFVLGALDAARRRGSRTVFIHCNPVGAEERGCDVVIRLPVGPEVLSGSTRMKSGTAQKMVLNLISTVAWVRQGKVFGNLMVDLQARSEKLRVRGLRLVATTTGSSRAGSSRLLDRAGGSVKVAIYMGRTGCGVREARRALRTAGGFLRVALDRAGVRSDPFPPTVPSHRPGRRSGTR